MTTRPTLDESPPDWAGYAARMADYAAECNAARARQEARRREEADKGGDAPHEPRPHDHDR